MTEHDLDEIEHFIRSERDRLAERGWSGDWREVLCETILRGSHGRDQVIATARCMAERLRPYSGHVAENIEWAANKLLADDETCSKTQRAVTENQIADLVEGTPYDNARDGIIVAELRELARPRLETVRGVALEYIEHRRHLAEIYSNMGHGDQISAEHQQLADQHRKWADDLESACRKVFGDTWAVA